MHTNLSQDCMPFSRHIVFITPLKVCNISVGISLDFFFFFALQFLFFLFILHENPLPYKDNQFSSVYSLSCVQLIVTPWTTACQAFLSITKSQSPAKLKSIELVMPSNHLILCHPLLLLPSIFPSSRVFPNETALHIRWPKYWSFSFSISPSNEYSGNI